MAQQQLLHCVISERAAPVQDLPASHRAGLGQCRVPSTGPVPAQFQSLDKRSRALPPPCALAGDHLCAMLISTGKADIALTLCKEIALRAPQVAVSAASTGLLDSARH